MAGSCGADGDLVAALGRLDELVRTLRRECPWDREQTHTSLRRYLLEETYETLEALDAMTGADGDGGGGDREGSGSEGSGSEDLDQHLCEELGDLLYQVWFQAHLASERDAFDMADVAREVRAKLVARHPPRLRGRGGPRRRCGAGACGTPSSCGRRGGTR